MPDIKSPPNKVNTKGSPPPAEKPSRNLTKNPSNKEVPLNFKVESEFRRAYKSFAVENDVTMNHILRRSFELLQQHGL